MGWFGWAKKVPVWNVSNMCLWRLHEQASVWVSFRLVIGHMAQTCSVWSGFRTRACGDGTNWCLIFGAGRGGDLFTRWKGCSKTVQQVAFEDSCRGSCACSSWFQGCPSSCFFRSSCPVVQQKMLEGSATVGKTGSKQPPPYAHALWCGVLPDRHQDMQACFPLVNWTRRLDAHDQRWALIDACPALFHSLDFWSCAQISPFMCISVMAPQVPAPVDESLAPKCAIPCTTPRVNECVAPALVFGSFAEKLLLLIHSGCGAEMSHSESWTWLGPLDSGAACWTTGARVVCVSMSVSFASEVWRERTGWAYAFGGHRLAEA